MRLTTVLNISFGECKLYFVKEINQLIDKLCEIFLGNVSLNLEE